jgi:hypothetical protein
MLIGILRQGVSERKEITGIKKYIGTSYFNRHYMQTFSKHKPILHPDAGSRIAILHRRELF